LNTSRFKEPVLFSSLDVASFVRELDESFSESQQIQMTHLNDDSNDSVQMIGSILYLGSVKNSLEPIIYS